MAAEKRQHEKWNAILVSPAEAAALADRGFPEKPAIILLTTEDTEVHRVSLGNATYSVCLCVLCGKPANSHSGGVHARTVFPDTSLLRPERLVWDLRSEWPGDIHSRRVRAGRWCQKFCPA